jgi:hypothetical protein
MPNDPLLARALALLAKADSTTYEEERSALVYGGYILLARYLAAHPAPATPEGRRRERRLVADRRRRAARAARAAGPSRPDAGAAYGTAGRPDPAGPGGLIDATV